MKNMAESERSPLGLAWTDRDGEVHLLQRLGTRLQQHRQDNCQPNKIPAPLLHSFTSPSLSHFLLVFLLFCILRFELSTVPQFWHTNLHTLLNADFAQEMAVLVMLTAYCLSDQAQWSLYVPRSGNYMYRKVVIICTASLTLKNSFSPHSVFMCFVWISEQTAIISLYNINWLVFITEMERVYCAVRTMIKDGFRSLILYLTQTQKPHMSSLLCKANRSLTLLYNLPNKSLKISVNLTLTTYKSPCSPPRHKVSPAIPTDVNKLQIFRLNL